MNDIYNTQIFWHIESHKLSIDKQNTFRENDGMELVFELNKWVGMSLTD